MKEILRDAISRAETVRVRNALNPLLWLTALVSPTFLLFAWLLGTQTGLGLSLGIVALLPPLATIIAYFIFLVKDPDRLQSEEYLLEHYRLSHMERKGDGKTAIEAKPPSESFLDVEEGDR